MVTYGNGNSGVVDVEPVKTTRHPRADGLYCGLVELDLSDHRDDRVDELALYLLGLNIGKLHRSLGQLERARSQVRGVPRHGDKVHAANGTLPGVRKSDVRVHGAVVGGCLVAFMRGISSDWGVLKTPSRPKGEPSYSDENRREDRECFLVHGLVSISVP